MLKMSFNMPKLRNIFNQEDKNEKNIEEDPGVHGCSYMLFFHESDRFRGDIR